MADLDLMKLKLDPEANAAYIRFSDQQSVDTRNAPRNGGDVFIDQTKDRTAVGVEILGVRQGVDLPGIPEADQVAELLRANGFSAYKPGKWPPNWRPGKGRIPPQKSVSGGKHG